MIGRRGIFGDRGPVATVLLVGCLLLGPSVARSEHGGPDSASCRYLASRLAAYVAGEAYVRARPRNGPFVLAAWTPFPAVHTSIAPADTTEPERERVEKKQKKKKGDDGTTKGDDEGGTTSSCFGDCLGGFFAGMFFSDDDEPEEFVPADETETFDAVPPFDAVIDPRNPNSDELPVWDEPGGRAADASILGTLGRGEGVTVTERVQFGVIPWLRIVTWSTPATVGWVAENDVARLAEPGGTAPEPIAGAAEEPMTQYTYLGAREQRWGFLMDIGVPVFTEGQINDEYLGTAITMGLATRLFMLHSFQLSAGASFLYSGGEPKYDYIVGTVTESPSDSKLIIWEMRVGGGQLYQIGGQGFFLWEVSPSIFHVKESADITLIENKVVIGRRTDELSEWKGGFRAKVEAGVLIDPVPISGYVSYAFFPWHSSRQKSLTFDYLEKSRVVIFAFGVTIGYSFF